MIVSHMMKKSINNPVQKSQTLDGASCCYSQRSKVVAAVGRLLLRASSRSCCRVWTTRRRQLKQQHCCMSRPSSTQHNIVQDFFGGQRRRRLRVILFSVLATILTLGKRGLGLKIESRWSSWGLLKIVCLTLFQLGRNNFYHCDSISRDKA